MQWCGSAHLRTCPACPPPLCPPAPLLPPCCPARRSARQTYFARTAGLLLGLQIAYSTAFVAAYASVVASQNCDYPWSTLSGLTFLQVLRPLLPAASLVASWSSCCHLLIVALAGIARLPPTPGPGGRCLPAAATPRPLASAIMPYASPANCECLYSLTMQWTSFSLIMCLFLARLQNMTVWRGEGALAMDVSGRLPSPSPEVYA